MDRLEENGVNWLGEIWLATKKAVRHSTPFGVGTALSMLSASIAENTYLRFNRLKSVADFLHQPDYLTSFAYPLTVMYALRAFAGLGREEATDIGNAELARAYDRFIWLIPIAIMGLDIVYETTSRPKYPDHPVLDVAACALAVGVYVGAELLARRQVLA